MWRIGFVVVAVLLSCVVQAQAADCGRALFDPTTGVFAHEGGYQNSKGDGGNWSSGKVGKGHMCGGTKFGIACAYNPTLDIKNLTKDKAAQVYSNNQCKELRMPELMGQKIPSKLLDLAVNMGTGTAIKIMTKTINRLNGTAEVDFPVKPLLTNEVVMWYNHYTMDTDQRSIFYLTLILEALDRYSDIVESNPKQAQWLLGWIIRLNPYSD